MYTEFNYLKLMNIVLQFEILMNCTLLLNKKLIWSNLNSTKLFLQILKQKEAIYIKFVNILLILKYSLNLIQTVHCNHSATYDQFLKIQKGYSWLWFTIRILDIEGKVFLNWQLIFSLLEALFLLSDIKKFEFKNLKYFQKILEIRK